MKKIFLALSVFAVAITTGNAQNFLNKATIEYEVKTNLKKTLPNDMWGEAMKDKLPEFKTSYYHYTFSDNKSIYQYHHQDERNKIPEWMRRNEEDNAWFFDHNTSRGVMQKNVAGTNFIIDDSTLNIKWKLSNENRVIAGFNCRKATGIIMDSVYVFAFYTDEIMIPGGPCNINGLPGLVMGLTIPRMYTSWIATKVMVNGIDLASIKPATSKKPYKWAEYTKLIKERTKDWVETEPDDPDANKWYNLFVWNAFL
jgi:GLPGLI family protein